MKILVKVKARAKKYLIEEIGENSFRVLVKEPAERGEANAAVIELLADYFRLPANSISIKSGRTSSQKILEIPGR